MQARHRCRTFHPSPSRLTLETELRLSLEAVLRLSLETEPRLSLEATLPGWLSLEATLPGWLSHEARLSESAEAVIGGKAK